MVTINNFTRESIREQLIICLKYFAGDKALHEEIEDDMVVLTEWGIESQEGVELAGDIYTRFGIAIPNNENPLVEDDPKTHKRRAKKFGEVVDYLFNLVEEGK